MFHIVEKLVKFYIFLIFKNNFDIIASDKRDFVCFNQSAFVV